MFIINAHTHLELSDKSHLLPEPSAEFSSWLFKVIQSNYQRTPESTRAACEAGLQELLAAGTTHIGDISASGLSVELIAQSGLQGIVWIEILATTMKQGMPRLDFLKRYVNDLRELAANSQIHVGVTLHSTYSIHPGLWEPTLRWIEAEMLPLCVHAAESPAEWELLTQGTGDFRVFEAKLITSRVPSRMKNIARKLLSTLSPKRRRQLTSLGIPYDLPTPMTTPIAYLEQKGVLAFKPLLIHAVHVSDEDIERIQRSGSTVVHCPRSNQRLESGRMPLEKYLALGVPVLMGTDSRTSSPSLDVREEATFAQTLHKGIVSPTQIDMMLRDVKTFEAHYK
ncbi:MAG: amidohydrolase family protein [Candidatus Parabeggiatoa sp.]|nr:amidohydrolase family protein [Candidatus Parabeggiatoa sp.]